MIEKSHIIKPKESVHNTNNEVMVVDIYNLELIFNEWNKRYSEDPESFLPNLDENGNPIEDYGFNCAVYFKQLCNELIEGAK